MVYNLRDVAQYTERAGANITTFACLMMMMITIIIIIIIMCLLFKVD